jgi:hypothetical protein
MEKEYLVIRAETKHELAPNDMTRELNDYARRGGWMPIATINDMIILGREKPKRKGK